MPSGWFRLVCHSCGWKAPPNTLCRALPCPVCGGRDVRTHEREPCALCRIDADRLLRAVSVWGAMAAAIAKHERMTWQDNGEPDVGSQPLWFERKRATSGTEVE